PATSGPTPGSGPSRTASTRRCSSATGTRCSAAGRGPPTPAPAEPPSATGTSRSAARSSPASDAPGTTDDTTPQREVDPPRPGGPHRRGGGALMCRHLAYLGPARSLASLLYDPPHSLEHQSHRTYEQRWVTMNPDGWGVGWWDPEVGETPARYRTDKPMWADRSFRSVADVVRAGAVVAAVRAATPGTPVVETGSAPFAEGRWLFSLNGYVSDFPGPAADRLRRALSPARSAALEGTTDSEVLFGLVLDAVDGGATPAEACAAVA